MGGVKSKMVMGSNLGTAQDFLGIPVKNYFCNYILVLVLNGMCVRMLDAFEQ